MPSHQARFVTLCQQLLALGVVLAVLTPAASIVSLDVVGRHPATGTATAGHAVLSSAQVPTTAVEPTVTEYALTPTAGGAGRVGAGRKQQPSLTPGQSTEPAAGETEAVAAAPVEGYGAIGVTWAGDESVEEGELELEVRTREGDGWSGWAELEYHDDHGPDPASAEAARAKGGTDPLIVGDVDEVQVRVAGEQLPGDLELAVVDPGEAEQTREEAPQLEIDPSAADPAATTGAEDGLALQAAAAAQPTIYSRAQWGADEKIRHKDSLRYGSISAGFVHHTVNANDYTEDQVPGILRSIYAYHVKSRGWSDIGYNFLVDRFGRIWEGRYGGIDKPVVGAHTLGYNDYAFAMSAIGNFDVVQPSSPMLQAYGTLFAWKLGLHGVDPTSTSQKVGKSTFPAINGHRDAGSTACPGKYLYAKLPEIRTAADSGATPPPAWGAAALQSNLAGTPHPDLVVRRAGDGQGLIIPTGGLTAFQRKVTVSASGWNRRADVLVSPDLTGDGIPDLLSTARSGVAKVRPGNGAGRFLPTVRKVKPMKGHRMLTAVGDINSDGRNDLVARVKGSREAVAFVGSKKYGFTKVSLGRSWGRYTKLIGVGDINTDGRPDLLGRDKAGKMWTRLGNGSGGFGRARGTAGDWSAYDQVVGGPDFTGDGRPDLAVRQRTGRVWVLPGVGDGSFGPALGPVDNLKGISQITAAQVTGSPAPDLVGRKGGALVVMPNRGTFELGAPIDTGSSLAGADVLLNAGDWDRDGYGDVLSRQTDGTMVLRRGNGTGQLAAPVLLGSGWTGITGVAAVGDVSGDGYPDVVGQPPGQPVMLYRGQGAAGFLAPVAAGSLGSPPAMLAARTKPSYDLSPYDWVIGISDAQLGKNTDVLVREAATGRLYLVNGTPKGLKQRRYLGDGMGAYDLAG